jgi:hypothetical protein
MLLENINVYWLPSHLVPEDKKLAKKIVEINGETLKIIPHSLVDREITLTAILNGAKLTDVLPKFLEDDEILTECLKRYPKQYWINLINSDHPRYREALICALKHDPPVMGCAHLFSHVCPLLQQEDEEISILCLVLELFYPYVSSHFKHDRVLVLQAVGAHGNIFSLLPYYQRCDSEIALSAARNYPYAMEFFEGIVASSYSFILECFRIHFAMALVTLSNSPGTIIPHFNIARLYLCFAASPHLTFTYQFFHSNSFNIKNLRPIINFCVKPPLNISPSNIPSHFFNTNPNKYAHPRSYHILYPKLTRGNTDLRFSNFTLIRYTNKIGPFLGSICNRSFKALSVCAIYACSQLISTFCFNIRCGINARSFSFPICFENGYGQPFIDILDIKFF